MDEYKKKYETLVKIIEEASSTYSMDNSSGPHWLQELEAAIDGTRCEECGGFPNWMNTPYHMRTCSKYVEPKQKCWSGCGRDAVGYIEAGAGLGAHRIHYCTIHQVGAIAKI